MSSSNLNSIKKTFNPNKRHKQVLKTENPGKRIAFLENEHSKSFVKWLRKEVERELAISKESVSETNSGVSVEAIYLHVSKEVATTRQSFYYGVLQEIWVLDYCFRQIPLFKFGDWVNHRAGDVKRDNLGIGYVKTKVSKNEPKPTKKRKRQDK
ncbi:hypothetical protein Tco_0855484 [Tanacetum coccineum]